MKRASFLMDSILSHKWLHVHMENIMEHLHFEALSSPEAKFPHLEFPSLNNIETNLRGKHTGSTIIQQALALQGKGHS